MVLRAPTFEASRTTEGTTGSVPVPVIDGDASTNAPHPASLPDDRSGLA